MTEANDEIKTYKPTLGHLDDLRERCRLATNHDHWSVEIATEDLQWLLLRAAPVVTIGELQLGEVPKAFVPKRATVFWDGTGFFWTRGGEERRGPFTGTDGLDDAIHDARQAGYKIAAVNRAFLW